MYSNGNSNSIISSSTSERYVIGSCASVWIKEPHRQSMVQQGDNERNTHGGKNVGYY